MICYGNLWNMIRYLERVDMAVQEAKKLAEGMSSLVLMVTCQTFFIYIFPQYVAISFCI